MNEKQRKKELKQDDKKTMKKQLRMKRKIMMKNNG